LSVVDQTDRPPETVLFVQEKIMVVPGWNYPWRLPDLSFCAHPLMYVLGNDAHILHDQLRIFEDIRIDPLEDKFALRGSVERDDVGVIDVAIAKFLDLKDVSGVAELLGDEGKIFQGITPIF
jgi:hypothetical protein